MPVLRQHHSRHFMVETTDHLFVGPKLEKGKIKTGKLDFEDVCFVKELQYFNLFFVSQMCDKKNKVLFTDTECLVLSPDFRLPDENQVLLRVPRQNNMYSFNLENIIPYGGLACLIAKATRKGPNWLFDLDYLTDSMNYQPVRSENQANKHAGPKEANHSAGTQDNIDAGNSKMEVESAQDYFCKQPICLYYTSTVKSSEAKNEGEKPNKNNDLKINEKPVDQEDQAFLDELERLKRQEKEANDAAEALRKEFAQDTKDLLLQAGAARASSTNTVNTTSTPVSTASPSGGLSYTDLTNTDQDDSQIPALEDIYDNPNDGIFTNASYDDEGAVADFTNLETIVNVSPIPTSRIHSIHPSTQILGDPKSAVQTRSKVNKSSEAHAFEELLQQEYRKCWILVDFVLNEKDGNWDKMGFTRNKKDEKMCCVEIRQGWLSQDIAISYPDGCEDCLFPYGTNDPELQDRVNSKTSHLNAMRESFRVLKGQNPYWAVGILESHPFNPEAYSNSDYCGVNLDRKSTTEVVNFLAETIFHGNAEKQQLWLLLL
ncbi:hypothetical protein Tco_1183887 [Tanacetum coccineum]